MCCLAFFFINIFLNYLYCLHLGELRMKDTPTLLNSIKNLWLALENHKINVIKKWNRRYRNNRVLTNTYSIREPYISHPNNLTFPCNTTYMWVFFKLSQCEWCIMAYITGFPLLVLKIFFNFSCCNLC